MKYGIDLTRVALLEYKGFLKEQDLIPSRQILHEEIDENFKALEGCGFVNLAELKQGIANGAKIEKVAKETGISAEYLNILRRELGTFDKAGVAFKDFPIIDGDVIAKLDKKGMRTTKDFFEYYYEGDNRKSIANEFEISKEMVGRLVALSSLVRINGIAALAAVTFYEAGYEEPGDIIASTNEEMLAKIKKVNDEKQYYKAKLGLKDMQFVRDFAGFMERFEG